MKIDEYYEQIDIVATELSVLMDMIDKIPKRSKGDMFQELDVFSRDPRGLNGLEPSDIRKVSEGLTRYQIRLKNAA